MKLWCPIIIAAGLLASVLHVSAGEPAKLNLNITGTVIANGSCTFNKGKTLTVDFGDVNFSTVNGTSTLDGTYRKPLSSTMTCTGDSAGKTQLTFKSVAGGTIDFKGQKLLPVSINASNPGKQLGIKLLVNGVAQDVDSAFAVDMLAQPELQVELVLVGDGTGLINGAPISASATLVMEFV